MHPSILSDISHIKHICDQNNFDPRESLKILSSLVALSQLQSVPSQEDDETHCLSKKSIQAQEFLDRHLFRLSRNFPEQDQQALDQIQNRFKETFSKPAQTLAVSLAVTDAK